MDVEAAMMRALEATRGFRIEGSQLELLGAEGIVVARFEAKKAP